VVSNDISFKKSTFINRNLYNFLEGIGLLRLERNEECGEQ
jgi:hypothetical protein